jgi:hypothetical protein
MLTLIFDIISTFFTPENEENHKFSSTAIIGAGNILADTGTEDSFKAEIGNQVLLMAKETGVPSDDTANLRVVITVTRI